MFSRVFFIISLLGFFLLLVLPKAHADSILDSSMYSGIVVNADTGEILYHHKAHSSRYPASLTKVMTLYLTFEALAKGKLTPQSKIKISLLASQQPPSNLNLKPGSTITVMEAIQAMIVKSANDVAYAVAEHLGGNTGHFAHMMNNKAKQLGMKNTRFYNPHGLFHEAQCTTAHDMARLALAIQKHHRKYFHLFALKAFRFKGKVIRSHNHVLLKYQAATGLKTGFITASGFNVVTTAQKPEGNLIAVVMGGQTARIRDNHMIELLQSTYDKLISGKSGKVRLVHARATLRNQLSAQKNSSNIKQNNSKAVQVAKRNDVFAVLNVR